MESLMQFLEFTFASFWHFVGVLFLIAAISSGMSDFIRALFIRKGWGLVSPQFKQSIIEAIREERNTRKES